LYKGSDKLPGGHFHCSIAETASEPFLFYLYFFLFIVRGQYAKDCKIGSEVTDLFTCLLIDSFRNNFK